MQLYILLVYSDKCKITLPQYHTETFLCWKPNRYTSCLSMASYCCRLGNKDEGLRLSSHIYLRLIDSIGTRYACRGEHVIVLNNCSNLITNNSCIHSTLDNASSDGTILQSHLVVRLAFTFRSRCTATR